MLVYPDSSRSVLNLQVLRPLDKPIWLLSVVECHWRILARRFTVTFVKTEMEDGIRYQR